MAGGLVLGPVAFEAFEVPERIRFGGAQRLAVHAMPGGGRVVDVLGPEEAPIEWGGVVSGVAAAARVRVLDGLRRDGSVLLLAWGGWRYSVIIERFRAAAVNPAWIPYSLRVCVVSTVEPGVAGDLLATAAAAAALYGAGPDVDEQIGAASADLVSTSVGVAIDAAGSLARLVTARALAGVAARGAA